MGTRWQPWVPVKSSPEEADTRGKEGGGGYENEKEPRGVHWDWWYSKSE